MNLLGFVFCIITILSFGAIASFQKQVESHRIRSSYLGHLEANRHILNQVESEYYASLKQAPNQEEKEPKETAEHQDLAIPAPPRINPACARLNLYPLVANDRMQDSLLYEMAAKCIGALYGKTLFDQKERSEYKFLDAFLKELRDQIVRKEFSILEKVSFKDPQLQFLYYKMLKGTKNPRLDAGGYPSLLEYIKVEAGDSKLCLAHAHPLLLSAFFTPKAAETIYIALHTPKAPPVLPETIQRICQEAHAPLLNLQIFELFEIEHKRQTKPFKELLIGEDPDTHVQLKKQIEIHSF
jgi:hypothetical protein